MSVAVSLHTESGRKQADDGVNVSSIAEKSGRKVGDKEERTESGEEKLTSPGEIVEQEYTNDKRSHENDKLPVVIEADWRKRGVNLDSSHVNPGDIPQFQTQGQWLHRYIRWGQRKGGSLLTGPSARRIYHICGSASSATASLPGKSIMRHA
jgi:hypothetical protein